MILQLHYKLNFAQGKPKNRPHKVFVVVLGKKLNLQSVSCYNIGSQRIMLLCLVYNYLV